jgi:hypothetical protein
VATRGEAEVKSGEFLHKLTEEARFQAVLRHNPVFPKQIDPLTELVGKYPWQTILVASGLTAILLELLT